MEIFIRKQLVKGGNTKLLSNNFSGMKNVILKIKKVPIFFGILLPFYDWHEFSLVTRAKRRLDITLQSCRVVQIAKFMCHVRKAVVLSGF